MPATVREEDVIKVLREVHDPEIPVNIVDLGLVYEIKLQPERVDAKMTRTALGCPMAAEVMEDVRDHLLQLPTIKDAGVELVYDPPDPRPHDGGSAVGAGNGLVLWPTNTLHSEEEARTIHRACSITGRILLATPEPSTR